MIKFLLVFQMCYSISQTCLPPMKEKVYETHRECSLNGYYKAHEFVAGLPPKEVESNRTIIKFWCEPKKIEADEKKINI
jgi:hypothetical protein